MAGTVTYIAPIDNASGKIFGKKNKWTACNRKNVSAKYERGCTFGGTRNYVQHPLSQDETNAMDNFAKVAKAVNARLKKTSATYEQDIMAFVAQRDLPGGYKTMKKWLWSVERAKLG